MFFERVYDPSLAQASFVIGCQVAGVAAVIDPKRDVDSYLHIVRANKLKITHILETHIHADFLCGSRELAEITGAQLYLSDEGDENWKYAFDHVPLRHGDNILLGNVLIEVLFTPGHTPEHISFLVTDKPATSAPGMLFTGDFIFVGDVGRPDLLEQAAGIKGTQEIGASQLFDSLHDFVKLHNHIQVWPGHGAGSACGKALGSIPMTTVGYEKIRNWALQMLGSREAFTSELLADQPEPPRYFGMMKKLNKAKRPLLTQVPQLNQVTVEQYEELNKLHLPMIDTRPLDVSLLNFYPGSYIIPNNNSFPTWMGWLMDYDKPFILLAHEHEMEDITRKLMRIGMDPAPHSMNEPVQYPGSVIVGYIIPEQLAAYEHNQPEIVRRVDREKVKQLQLQPDVQLVDVRSTVEYKKGCIDGAKHVFLGTLLQNLNKISADQRVIVYCQTGSRSAMAYSLLVSRGYKHVYLYSGGWDDWNKA